MWDGRWKRSRIKEGLGAFAFGRRIEFASRNLPACESVCCGDGGSNRSIPEQNSGPGGGGGNLPAESDGTRI